MKPAEVEIDIDKIITKLLSVRRNKPGKLVNLTEQEIKGLCFKSQQVFLSQPMLLELEAPLKICGIKVVLINLNEIKGTFMDNFMIC